MQAESLLIAERLKNVSVPTGSKAYGLPNWNDEDYLILRDQFETLIDWEPGYMLPDGFDVCGSLEYEDGSNTTAVRFKVGNEVNYNFIVCHNQETFDSWVYATNKLKKMSNALLYDKADRIRHFKAAL